MLGKGNGASETGMEGDLAGILEEAWEWLIARTEVPTEELGEAVGLSDLVEFSIGKGGTIMVGIELEVPDEGVNLKRVFGLVGLVPLDEEKAVKPACPLENGKGGIVLNVRGVENPEAVPAVTFAMVDACESWRSLDIKGVGDPRL